MQDSLTPDLYFVGQFCPEFLREGDGTELDEIGDWIDVECMRFTSQSSGLNGYGPAACEHIQQLWARGPPFGDVFDGDLLSGFFCQPLGMSFENMPLCVFDDSRIARILTEPLKELGRVSSAQTLLLIVRPVLRNEQRRRDKRSEHCRPARYQGPPRTPHMQR